MMDYFHSDEVHAPEPQRPWARKRFAKPARWSEALITAGIWLGFGFVMIPWLSIIATVVIRGSKAFYIDYLTTDMLVNSSDDPLNVGGVGHAVVGTLIMVTLAAAVAVPLGILSLIHI